MLGRLLSGKAIGTEMCIRDRDEMINNISDIPEIINEDMGISICNKDFNEDNMNAVSYTHLDVYKRQHEGLLCLYY